MRTKRIGMTAVLVLLALTVFAYAAEAPVLSLIHI